MVFKREFGTHDGANPRRLCLVKGSRGTVESVPVQNGECGAFSIRGGGGQCFWAGGTSMKAECTPCMEFDVGGVSHEKGSVVDAVDDPLPGFPDHPVEATRSQCDIPFLTVP